MESRRMGKLNGMIHRLSTSRSRNSFNCNWSVGVINELNSILRKFLYSYFQYHWWAIHLMVRVFWFKSSEKYRILIDGIAIKIRMNMGIMVQISSIRLFCRRNRLVNLFLIIEIIINKIIIVIIIIIIIVKSWKNIIISKIGELESWKVRDQVLIFNKRLNFINDF